MLWVTIFTATAYGLQFFCAPFKQHGPMGLNWFEGIHLVYIFRIFRIFVREHGSAEGKVVLVFLFLFCRDHALNRVTLHACQ